MKKINRREFVQTTAAAGAAAAAIPGRLFAQAPTMMTPKSVKPVVVASNNGNKFKNGGSQTGVHKDAWMMAYSPDLVLGAWAGRTGADGKAGTTAAFGTDVGKTISARFLNGHPRAGAHWYSRPSGLVQCRNGELFLPGTESRSCGAGDQGGGQDRGGEQGDKNKKKGDGGEVTLAFAFHGPVLDQAVDERGAMPLPPYIASRRAPDERDRTDYQTVFAQVEEAVAPLLECRGLQILGRRGRFRLGDDQPVAVFLRGIRA